jgi:hypothetical protein
MGLTYLTFSEARSVATSSLRNAGLSDIEVSQAMSYSSSEFTNNPYWFLGRDPYTGLTWLNSLRVPR